MKNTHIQLEISTNRRFAENYWNFRDNLGFLRELQKIYPRLENKNRKIMKIVKNVSETSFATYLILVR